MPRLNFAPKIPEISDTRGVLGRWGLPHCGEIFVAGLVSPKYHGCILHLMKNAAKMTVVNAVKMMARAEMHFSWENFGISNLIKFDILHIFTFLLKMMMMKIIKSWFFNCYGNSCA